MKLATLKDGSRDGSLVVVSRDLARCVAVPEIAATMQSALDNWANVAPALMAVAQELESVELEKADEDARQIFDQQRAHSPLPRAYQWADGSAYVNHVALVRQARGAEMPDAFWHDPLIYQGGSDSFLAPRDPIPLADPGWGLDFEAEIAVITDDVPAGITADNAEAHIKLVMLVNDVSLRNLIPAELAKGFGFFQSKPQSAFSPTAVTLDELGVAWRGGKLHLPLLSDLNCARFGRPNAGVDMTFSFPQLIAHAAKTRPLSAGSIIGSGTVSNRLDGGPGRSIANGGAGFSCIAEARMVETITSGQPQTAFMGYGDTVRIVMRDREDRDIFGAIDQTVVKRGEKAE